MIQHSYIAICGLLVLTSGACSKTSTSTSPVSSSNSSAFQELLDASVQELRVKNDANKAWGLGTFDRWDIDQEVGDLVFSNADGTTVVAPAQIIGSFNTSDNSWLWAWDNSSIVDKLKLHALQVKQYGEQNHIEKLTSRKWTGTEEDAWAMAALAAKLCNAQGVYRGNSGRTFVFMTFGEVKISKPKDGP
jgi:hypothetical protein